MATLILNKIWINLLSSGQAISAPSTGRSLVYDIGGSVVTYAGGRQRAITSEGTRVAFGFTLRLVGRAIVDTLVAWQGQTVQIRDHRGQQFFAVFHQVTPVEYKTPTQWDVAVMAHVVTVPDEIPVVLSDSDLVGGSPYDTSLPYG